MPPSRGNEKAAPRACPVEATGMPKGTTHETPPNMFWLRMARYSPRRFRNRDIFVQLSCAAHPLSNDYQSFDRIRWYSTTFPWDIQAAKVPVETSHRENPSTHYDIRRISEKCDSARSKKPIRRDYKIEEPICLYARRKPSVVHKRRSHGQRLVGDFYLKITFSVFK